MDVELIKILLAVLGVGIVLFILARLANKPKKCEVCGTDTRSVLNLNFEKRNSVVLCNNHLADRWVKDVVATSYIMIIIEPDFESCPYGYVYGDVSDLELWSFEKEGQDNVSRILETIKGKICAECGGESTVAYFKKDDYLFPFFEKITATPSYFCKTCAVKKVEPSI